jgi:uncharacterized protein (TIGR02145 family)
MKKLILLTILAFTWHTHHAQEIVLSFNPVDATSIIDSIMVTNKETGFSVMVQETNRFDLNTVFSGIGRTEAIESVMFIFPNPFSGKAELQIFSAVEEDIEVLLSNLSGQLLTVHKQHLNPGSHTFGLSVSSAGLYTVSVLRGHGIASIKIVNTYNGNNRNTIRYKGIGGYIPGEKSFTVEGADLYHFKIFSGNRITVIADRPVESKSYHVEFMECTDPGGRNYPVVQIGNQWWMTENLGLHTGEGCWAYKNEEDYVTKYGRLYKWEIAMNACPDGWYLPTYNDWEQLAQYVSDSLGPFENDFGEWQDLGVHLKSTNGWEWEEYNLNGSDDFGFSALPGGMRSQGTSFFNLNFYGFWWTSTEDSPFHAWLKALNSYEHSFMEENFYEKEAGLSIRCVRYQNQTIPVVSTNDMIGTGKNRAVIRSLVISEGNTEITEKGVCYNFLGNPTVYDSRTINKEDTFAFMDTIMGLTPDTTYFVRTYATNSSGTAYGDEKVFKTKDPGLETGRFADKRDSKNYKWVQIGEQTWMAENLAYETDDSRLVFDNEYNFASGGRYYTWEAALNACPEGWRLPSNADWEQLANYISDTFGPYRQEGTYWNDVAKHLKSTWGWMEEGNGSDDFGFSALPLSSCTEYGCENQWLGKGGGWWCLDANASSAWSRGMNSDKNRLWKGLAEKNNRSNIRCIKTENLSSPYIITDTVTDINTASAVSGGHVTYNGGAGVTSRGVCWNKSGDPTILDSVIVEGSGLGKFTCRLENIEPATTYFLRAFAENSEGISYGEEMVFYTLIPDLDSGQFVDHRDTTTYKWVEIGEQVWMAENLAYNTNTGCWPDEGKTQYISVYGRLYTWETATKVCPEGWHLPTDKEWEQLAQHISNTYGPYSNYNNKWNKVGMHLKSSTLWWDKNGMDHFGFKALPGGFYPDDYGYGIFTGSWWSATANTDESSWFRRLDQSDAFYRESIDNGMYFSVRCVRDETE